MVEIGFRGKIIDSHSHVGKLNNQSYSKSQLDVFVKEPLPNNDTVEKMLVSDLDVLHSLKDEYGGNIALLQQLDNSGKYEILASCSPKDGNVKNIQKLFEENPKKFIGLKFHPEIQKLPLADEKYEPYMKFANENRIPCLFHSSVALDKNGKIRKDIMDISDPEFIYGLAKKYKDTPVVMAHMGAGWKESHDKAINVLIESIKNGDANLYADISWVDIGVERNSDNLSEVRSKEHVIKAIKRLKGIGEKDWKYGDQSFRLMFGSDAPLDRFKGQFKIQEYTRFIEDIKSAIRRDNDLKADSEKIIEDLFYSNAENLYLKSRPNISSKTAKRNIGKYIAFGVTLFAGILLAVCKLWAKSNDK